MDNYRYLILLDNNREAIKDWFLWRRDNDKVKATRGKMCAILMDDGVVVSTVDELSIPKSQHWVIVAYVKGESKTELANKLKGQKYRIFFHGGSANVGGGRAAIEKSWKENYGDCGFKAQFMYFSGSGRGRFPADSALDQVKNIFAESAKRAPT